MARPQLSLSPWTSVTYPEHREPRLRWCIRRSQSASDAREVIAECKVHPPAPKAASSSGVVDTRRLATVSLGPAVVVDEPLSSSESAVTWSARRLARAKRARPVSTTAGTLGKCTPRGHTPGFVVVRESGKTGLAVGGPQTIIDPALILIVVLETGGVLDAVGVVPPADDLIPAKAAERRILLLVRVRAELTEGAGDLDEVGRRRYFIDVAVPVEHLPEETDSGVFAGGSRDIAVVIPTCAVGGADGMVVHANVGDNLKNLTSSSRSKEARGAHFSRSPGISAPHPELGIAESSP